MDRTIEIKVNGSYLTKDNRVGGVQHEANATTMRIEFDGGWDGYAKKVTFWDAKGLNPVERTLTTDLLEDATASTRIYLCPIPGEALAECGECTFVIDGYVSGKRQRSISDTLLVREAPFIEQADQPADPTPTQAEQLQAEIDSIQGTIQSAITSAETAQAAQAAAEAAKDSAESAALAAEGAKDVAIQAQISAESAGNSAQSSASAAAANRTASEAAQKSAEAAQAAAESASDTAVNAKDSAKDSAALAMGYAIGTVSNPFAFTVPANSTEDYVVLADPGSPAILEDGKRYRITVNREIAYATASGGSISALGVTITAGSSSYHVENQNGYDVTGSFGEAATQTIGKSAAEYADEASRAAAVASGAETTATEQAALARASETAAKASETAAAASADAAAASAARAEEVVGGDYATRAEFEAHTGNADVHVTAAEKASWDGKAENAKYVSVTLTTSGWDSTAKTQTVTVNGVSATETAQLITPVPALASQAAYYDAGIKCTGQAANSLTFTADTVPTADLTVYVTIQEVSA